MKRRLALFAFAVVVSTNAFGATFENIDGVFSGEDWSLATTWNITVGSDADAIPDADDDVIIRGFASGRYVVVSGSQAAASVTVLDNLGTARLDVLPSATLTVGGNVTAQAPSFNAEINVTGDLIVGGDLTATGTGTTFHLMFGSPSGNLLLSGDLTGFQNLLIATDGLVALVGTTAQTVQAGTYGNVDISNPAGVTVPSGQFAVDGLLDVAAGASLSAPTVAINADAVIDGVVSSTLNVLLAPTGSLAGSGSFQGAGPVEFSVGGSRTITTSNFQVFPSAVVNGGVQNDGFITFAGSVGGTGTWTQGINSTLVVGGSFSPFFSAAASPNLMSFNGAAAQTIPVPSGGGGAYHHLTLTGGTKSSGGAFSVNGDLTIDGGADFTVDSTGLTVGADFHILSGMINGGPAPLVVNGGEITGGSTAQINVPLELNVNTSLNGATGFWITGAVTLGSVTTVTNNGFVLLNDVFGTGPAAAWIQAPGATLQIFGDFLATGTLTNNSPSVVMYDGAGAQTVKAAAYDTLRLTNTGFKDLSGVTTVNAILDVGGSAATTFTAPMTLNHVSITTTGAVDFGSFTHTISGLGTIAGPGVTASSATLHFNGSAAAQNITLFAPVGNIHLSGTAAKLFQNALDVLGNFIVITAGTPIDGGGFQHVVGGDWSHAGGTMTAFSVNFSRAAGSQTIGFGEFGILEFNGGATKTAAASLLADSWIIRSGSTFNAGSNIHTITGHWTNEGSFVPATSNFQFTGGVNQIIGGPVVTTFYDITVNKTAGSVALANAVTIDNDLTLTSGTFDATTFGAVLFGDVSGAGTFNGDIAFSGPVAQTWVGPAASLGRLTVNGAGGVSFSVSPTVSAQLELSGGNITVSPGQHLAVSEPATIIRNTGFVVGELKMLFNASQTRTFHVGTAGGAYAPVDLTASGGAGALIVDAKAPAHPNAGPNSLLRWWNVSGATLTSPTMTFHYNAADVVGTESSYVPGSFNGTNWIRTGTVSAGTDTFTISGLGIVNGQWTAGEATALGEPHWIGAVSGNWSNGANWTSGAPPFPSDIAYIDAAGTYTVTLDTNAQVAGLQLGNASGAQTLTIPAVTLQLDGASTIAPTATVILNGGHISGDGNITNNGVMSLASGTLSGNRTLTSNGTVNFSGSSSLSIDVMFLINNNLMQWTGTGGMILSNSGRITNAAPGTFTVSSDSQVTGGTGGGDVINFGTMTKTAGAGATTIGGGAMFSSSGVVDVQSGSLVLSGSGNLSGQVALSGGAKLEIVTGGNVVFNSGLLITGAGEVDLDGGTLNLSGLSATIPNLSVGAGVLTGSASLSVPGTFDWSGGNLVGSGGTPTVTVGGPGTINSSNMYLDARVLQIAGATTWTGTHINLQNGGGITVLGTGTLTIATDAEIASISGTYAFNNAGTVIKTTTTGLTYLRATTFTNTGSVDIQSGSIRVDAGGSNSGPLMLGTSTALLINAGNFALNTGTTVTGAGKIAVNGGNLLINDVTTIPNLELGSGTVAGPSNLTVNNQFAWNGGTVGGGAGAILFLPGTALTQIATNNVRLDTRILDNSGTVNWGPSAHIDLLNGARIENRPGALFDAQGDRTVTHLGGAATAFNNAGTFTKTAGTGTTMFTGVPLTNDGVIDVRTGIVRMNSAAFTQSATGSLTLHLGGTTAGTGYAQVQLAPPPTLAGTLNVALVSPFTPASGNTFRLLSFTGSAIGDFATYNLAPPPPSTQWAAAFDSAGLLLSLGATSADLGITKTASAANVPTNTNVSFTIQVTNAGPDTATNVSVTDVIPASMNVASASGTGWTCTITTSVVCTLASLPVGPAAPLVIDMTTPATNGPITNVANVSAAETDPDSSDNAGSAVVNVGPSTSSYIVTTLADSGPGSLRQALTDAAAGVCVPCNITFNVPTPGVIDVLTQLPVPITTYSIDGTSQPGYAGTPVIGINGLPCGATCHGFSLQVGSAIRGLAVFNFFNGGAVWLEGSGSNSLTESWIGVDLSGAPAPNLKGVVVDGGSSNVVFNNRIANNTYGVYMSGTSDDNTVGQNVIENNATAGVSVVNGVRNLVLSNSMRANGIGIDLGDDGPTANDAGDPDTGANNLQNTPVIGGAAITGSTLTALVSLDSSSSSALSTLVELFAADASGTQGETIITQQCLAGNAFSNQAITAPAGALTGGALLVATASPYAGAGCTGLAVDGTSEFSAAAIVTCTPTPVSITTAPTVCASGAGSASVPAVAGATYSWTISNGVFTSPSNGNAITFTAGAAGSVSLAVSVTNSCGAVSNAATTVGISAPPASITASGPTTFCAGGSVTLTANAGGSGFTYLWSNGATTQSIVATASGSYSVTVTDGGGCSTTSSPTTVTVNPAPMVAITGPASVCQRGTPVTLTATGSGFTSVLWSNGATTTSITVTPSATTSYSVQVTGSGSCTATDSHTVAVGSGGGVLTVSAPPSVAASSAGNTASVAGGSAGTYTWTVINGTLTSGQGTPSITFDAGASGSVTIHVTLDDNGCAFNGTVTIPIRACATAAPSLVSPASGATVLSPVVFTWTAVPGATDYEVWRVEQNSPPVFVGLAPANATSLSARVESGTFSWYVVARLAQTCSPSQLQSESRALTVAPATNCPSGAPQIVRPQSGANTFSPVTLEWTAVGDPTLIGYRVMASLGGLPAVEIETTSRETTQLVVDLPVGTVTWWVEAVYEGCPPVRSGEASFSVVPEECSRHGNANLVRPADGAASPTSSVEFEWTAVDGADGYAVWAVINDEPLVLGSTVGELRLTAVVPPGLHEWWVETKFEGCPSTESARRFVRVPESANCSTQRPNLSSPSEGATFSVPRVDLAWTSVPNTLLYEIWLSVNGGSDALVATSQTNNASINVPAGEISWFVRARVNGCPDRDSDRRTLRYAPPAACTTAIPILLLPLDDGRPITSPATFRWTSVPGATEYRIYLLRANGVRELLATTRDAGAGNIVVPNGESRWIVEARFASCPPTESSASKFVAVPSPSSCTDVVAPVISVPGQVSAGTSFTVQWTGVPGADSYHLTEFAGATSRVIPVSGQFHTFAYPNTTNAAQTYVYQVRGVDADCNPAREGTLSAALGVTVLPVRSVEGSTVVGTHATIDQVIPIGPEFAGQSFTATALQPWISIDPSSGIVPAGGIDLLARADVTSLPLGTSVAGVQIAFGAPQSGRMTTNGGGSVNASISVNLVTPVTPTPKSAPGPDALIIPAVAHAQGVNAQFQSDVRISNTSAQVMKYQLTFVPTGEAGMTQGRQTSIDIEPGRTIALDDILRTWFGTGGASVLGTLEIRPLTQAGSSTSSAATRGVPNFVTFASSRTFNSTLNGTFGTYIPAIPFANFVGRATGTATPSILSLQQIAQSDTYRSNLGLLEGSGNPAEVLISVFNSSGTRITQFPVQLTGGQHLQIGSFLSERGITLDDGRVEAQVIGGTGRVMAYAAVVNNATGDSMVVTPVSAAQNGATKYVLPGVAELSAGTPWQTDMRLLNAGEQPVTATLSLHSLNGAAPEAQTVEVAPGETKTLDRVLATLFGVANDGGALHITTPSNSKLVATARTYRPSEGGGNFGQFIQAVTPNEAIAVGSRPLQILQVEESQRFRSNIGLAEVSGRPAKIEVTVIPPDAKVSAKLEVDLAANQFRQLNSVLSSIGFTSTHNARVTVRVISGEGRVTAYAATIDQVTQDPTFIPAQ